METMEKDHLLVEEDRGIATITLNRPEKRNALSLALMRDLTARLEEIAQSPRIRAVILAGAGPVFCAGHDLSELLHRSLPEYRTVFAACTHLMAAIQRIPQPVIARVHGMATAAGCQLVASCDLAVASEEAQFATPGVRLGLFCSTPMVALARTVGRKRALEMLLTGVPIDAHTAAAWGLVNRVVAREQLEEETLALARSIAEASPLTVALGKQAFYVQIDLDQEKAYAYACEVMSTNAMAADAQEGMCAFLEKRPATWQGR